MTRRIRAFGVDDPALAPASADEAAACPHVELESRYAIDGEL
jgi:hypothetical protein